MSRKIKNVNAMIAQLKGIQEQLKGMRALIEDEIGRGVTRLFLDGAGASEIYNFVEKVIAGSGYLDYVKLKREKDKKRKEKVGRGEAKVEREREKEREEKDEKKEGEMAEDSFWA